MAQPLRISIVNRASGRKIREQLLLRTELGAILLPEQFTIVGVQLIPAKNEPLLKRLQDSAKFNGIDTLLYRAGAYARAALEEDLESEAAVCFESAGGVSRLSTFGDQQWYFDGVCGVATTLATRTGGSAGMIMVYNSVMTAGHLGEGAISHEQEAEMQKATLHHVVQRWHDEYLRGALRAKAA